MPHIVGNTTYYEDIQREMRRLKCDMDTAEITLLYETIKPLRFEGWTHQRIREHVGQKWGLKPSTYQARLHWIRQRYALP